MWQLLSVLRIGLLICVIRKTQSCYEIVEKSKATEFRCIFSTTTTLITWQALAGNNALNLTTCNMASSVCTDQLPSVYKGRVLSSVPGNYTMGLNITSARINETRFRCLADSGHISQECGLEVYVWPTPPVCEPVKLNMNNLSLELTCTSSNVYPRFSARINRIGPPGVPLDVDFNNSFCNATEYGSGSLGDVSETCTWRIPVHSMPEAVYYFHIEITAFVTNSTTVTKSAVTSQNVTVDLRLPHVVIYSRKCPVGPGVVGGYIKVGTSATCTCEVEGVGLWGGQAEWFAADGRSVGANTLSDRSSTLIMSYNASDPDVAYECRGINAKSQYYFTSYKPKFPSPGCHVIVEKGQSTQLECPVQGPTNSLTWQVWAGGKYINVTTCTSAGACADHMSQVYKGNIHSSGVPQFSLDVISARSNETQFRCMTDDGKAVKICTLEPYRWPSTPTNGGMRLTNQYVEVTFSTVAYPDVDAVLHRRTIDVGKDDIDESYCSRSTSSTDPNSDYIIACTWRIPIAKMLLSNTFYVEMSLLVTNQTLVNRLPVVSNDTLISIGAVDVYLKNCPEEITKGTSATCTCTIFSSGFLNTVQARWFTASESVVGVENKLDGSSTLTVSFNSSDTSATYECRGTNPTRQYPYIIYQPQFSHVFNS